MASLWKIGSVDVYINSDDESGDPKIAELTPLGSSASSVIHFFGSAAPKVSVKGWVFSEANKLALKVYESAGTTIQLTSDQGNVGNYIIQKISFDRFNTVKLLLAGYAQSDTAYKFQASLIKIV